LAVHRQQIVDVREKNEYPISNTQYPMAKEKERNRRLTIFPRMECLMREKVAGCWLLVKRHLRFYLELEILNL